ncbi:MAG: porin [Burkholderiaceae bacterium]
MKKTLVALAALAAVGTVSAQSSVTVYGVLDVGYSNYENDALVGKVKQAGLSSSNTITSRLGFRGIEDIGGGIKAKFNLELGINIDDGSNQIGTNTGNIQSAAANPAAGGLVFGRLSYVAIEGKFGEIRLGRDIHPGYYNYVVFDPFGAVGAAASLPSVQKIDAFVGTGTQVRFSNGIGYFLPSGLGGIYGQVMYAPSEVAEPTGVPALGVNNKDDGEAFGFRIGYRTGPFDIALGYANVTSTVVGPVQAGAGVAAALGAGNDRETLNIAGSYDFGVVKLFAQYADLQVDSFRNSNQSVTNKSYLLGVHVPFGPQHLFKASIAASESSGQNSEETTKFGIGYELRLSKRTALYANYAQVANKNGGRIGVGVLSTNSGAYQSSQFASGFAQPNGGVGAGGGAVAAGGDSRGFDLGIRHTF